MLRGALLCMFVGGSVAFSITPHPLAPHLPRHAATAPLVSERHAAVCNRRRLGTDESTGGGRIASATRSIDRDESDLLAGGCPELPGTVPWGRSPRPRVSRKNRAACCMQLKNSALPPLPPRPNNARYLVTRSNDGTLVGIAPQMCTPEKPEAPTPSDATEGGAYSLHLRPSQTHPEEHVARVLMMVCGISEAEAASLATQEDEVRVGIWERAIAEHAYEGMTAQGVLADLMPAYVHRGEALAAVKADSMALKNALPELQADREVVMAAVQKRGWVLFYSSPELKADHEVVLAAVRQNGDVLRYASPELRAELMLVAAAQQIR